MEVGKLAHSHSQSGGMDRTPPGTPKKGGKMLAVRVQMLDDTITMFQVQAKALGKVLFEQVCNQLNLLESDYFGVEYQESGGTKYWLDLEKPLCRQVGLSLIDTLVRFCVKFYPPDPSQLEEEFTRYLFCLQIKRDLSQGLLQCNSNTAALMASYIVQAECGDYVVEDYPDHRYLSSYKFVPNQDQELERRIMENHKKHAGQTPAEADLNLLETARRCELYGIKMHPAKDHEGCPLNLAVAHMGIVVFQNFSKINTFSWAKIRKISFKRKRFLVKLHPEGYGYYKDTVEFFFEGRNECKNFWKKCVENHGFFRCTMVKKVPRQKTRVLSRGSSFRYSGRTQKQIVDYVRENYVKRQTFQRSQSFRHSSSAHSSVANVGTSISAHPLLPLGDNAVVGTPASLSCGSMTLTSSPVHIADIHAGGSPSPQLTTSVSQGTSVTSSPQHFYPQETPYRRAGHQLTKVKRPHVHSRHAISPLHSPTDAAKAAGNHSANHSNNVTVIDSSDVLSSRSSLRSPEFMTYNEIYSNCYTSLRDCGSSDNKLINGTKTDTFDKSCDFSNADSINHDPIKSFSKNSEVKVCGGDEGDEGYKRHRSASCKDIYHGENVVADRKNERNLKRAAGTSYEFSESYDKSRRKCYSAHTSKNPSIDQPGDVVNDMRIYSSSYPGTTSSLSTESAEGELIEALDAKYDSLEDVALSHDDVSHDSYELLERELDYNNETRNKRSRTVADNERARSCSWGSDRGDLISPLDFRSTENVIGSNSATEHNFWSLEREKNSKHRSEIDFRSFSHSQTGSKVLKEKTYEGKAKTSEFSAYNTRFAKRSREMDLDQFDNLIFNSKDVEGEELCGGLDQDMRLHLPIREGKENSKALERKICQSQRKSLEKLDSEFTFKMRADDRKRLEKKREKREKDERFHEGFKEKEQKRQIRGEEDPSCRNMIPKSNEYSSFQEIHFKKFDRVVSNQFGKYPEFLARENDFIAQEKVLENYEKMCQVGRIAKELKKSERTSTILLEKSQENIRKFEMNNLKQELENEQFQVLKKKSIGLANSKLGKAHVERTKSDPYNSIKNQKRSMLTHQKSIDLTPQQSEETASDYDEDGYKKTSRSEHDIPYILHKRHFMNGTARNADLELKMAFKPIKSSQKEAKTATKKTSEDSGVIKKFNEPTSRSSKLAEAKKAGVQIINLDLKSSKNVNILEPKIIGKAGKSSTTKKPLVHENKTVKKEIKKIDRSPEYSTVKPKKEEYAEEKEEPIYAEVCVEKILEEKIPPEPPARTSSVGPKPKETGDIEKRPPVELLKLLEVEESKKKAGKCAEMKEAAKGKQELPIVQRREESLTLFARTRLGLSEGSAFAPIVRQSNIGSPVTQRRTKSLDAPYVSVHSLPPADAFSSKDDTVDGNESDVVNAAVARFKEIGRKTYSNKSDKKDSAANTESEVDSVFTDDVGMENTFKKTVENQSRIEVLSDEKVLDAVRGKRLLSKIESVDFIDSEGDMDSSKLAEPVPIPSDRLVNLPESIRFPSVRQISGQTSEESADGWEQKEVKVKRRTPRRSVGREEQDIKESVVWDSKDEAPDDDVWDDSLPVKCEGSVGPSTEYLKRGSCGQSIDDDNLSTPMKESSPEHWVSVDDLPEALEREEKLLRQQEKILREKILNEKLKRELNLDTIDVDERFCENLKQQFEEESVSLKENFKGHSLDTYELTEKKLREKGNKNCSLDEDLLGNKKSHSSKMLKPSNYRGMDYIQCKVVKDVAEIDQFGDNDEELEEFFVLLDENLGKEDRNDIWDEESTFRRTISNDESLISVPEQFKDEKEEPYIKEVKGQSISLKMVEIRFSKDQKVGVDEEDPQSKNIRESKIAADGATLSPYSGSRRGSEENRKFSLTEESGRLSPYDNCSRRSSGDTRKLSCENAGRVSPFDESRRGSDDPRRLSTSEDSRKCSVSESVSEETRRRLSSNEETRRKRASLTKQCSVGAESISDDIISGIQECSSSFEQDEKDVFEEPNIRPETLVDSVQTEIPFEIEISKEATRRETNSEEIKQINGVSHLAPPTSERELSRDTEESVDYCEMDLKDITEVVKEKDISEESFCGNKTKSFEKSESLEYDELRCKDGKRGSTPEITLSKSRDAVATSAGVINEETSALNRLTEEVKVQSFARTAVENSSMDKQRRTVPKTISKPKPLTPKPVDYIHKKLKKVVSAMDSPMTELSSSALRSSLDSSQESDLDRLSDFSLITHVQNQIVRRNLSDAGRCLRRDEFEEKKFDDGLNLSQRTSSDEREKTESSSFEMRSSTDENADEGRRKGTKGEKLGIISGFERSRARSRRSPDQDKRDSGEDGSSSSSAPAYPKRELSSTWKPFLLESSGSSSLEEGWLPPDENAHLADEEETSSTSNNQQDDSFHEDVDYPTGVGYPVLNMPSAEMMVGGYGSVFALSRTLSRISERSTSEQDRSDEEDITKPSSHSVSAEEESILSSDHQPSLSSDPPSPKESSTIPDLPVDRPVPEPFEDIIPPPVPEDDWPSPPSSSSVIDTPVISHIETFYMEIHPEEACKVVVAEPQNEANSSSDENQTLQEESEIVHLSSDVSVSTTTTTQDGTVVVPVRPKGSRTGSLSEDASMSASEWSGSVSKTRTNIENEWQSPSRSKDPCYNESNRSVSSKYFIEDVQKPKIPPKIKPLKVISPTGKNFGFFETPVSKVRSPTSQIKFFETGERPVAGYPSLRSPTSFSETPSPKKFGNFFDCGSKTKSPTKGKFVCTPYYSNVADSAEKSYFGRYDTGSLERTKIQSSRKYCSYYSVSKTVHNEGDSSNSDGPPVTSPNTIPRASKRIKKRHRVAMDLVIRDGKIVAPPKTKTTVVENSDSDRSSPREFHSREYRGKQADA